MRQKAKKQYLEASVCSSKMEMMIENKVLFAFPNFLWGHKTHLYHRIWHFNKRDSHFKIVARDRDLKKFQAMKITKKMKKKIRTPKILIISHRFEVTDRKYFRISPWPASTLRAASSTLASILSMTSSCSLIMWASCWKIPPSSTIVDSMFWNHKGWKYYAMGLLEIQQLRTLIVKNAMVVQQMCQ